MRFKLIIIALLFLLFAIIAAQNTVNAQLNFLFWSVGAPIIVMIVVIFILGIVTGLILCSSYERKKRKQEDGIQAKKEEKDRTSNSPPFK